MMDSPFFRNHWSAPSQPRPPYFSPPIRAVPIQHPPSPSPSPKVVSIPVRFVGSERSRSDSALKIQSALRGFLVRRSVRRIAAVRREVEEIERMISTPEAAELMRRDERERVKVNEALMSLLFKLDSVPGVDAGVRDCRKAVIRRAIALQEKVDAIVAGGPVVDDSAKEADVEGGNVAERESVEADDCSSGVVPPSSTTEAVVPRLEEESRPEMVDVEHSVDAGGVSYQTEETPVKREVHAAPKADVCAKPEGEHFVETNAGRDFGMEQPLADEVDTEAREPETEVHENEGEYTADNYAVQWTFERVEDAMATGPESSADSFANCQSPIEGIGEHAPPAGRESPKPDENEESGGGCENEENNDRRSKELLEKMMEDHEKMMGLMAELFERNKQQTQLLSSLSQRVEQLERAFVCEKLRRKKRRQVAGQCDALGHVAGSKEMRKEMRRRRHGAVVLNPDA